MGIRGTLTTVGYPEGRGAYLSARGIRLFDVGEFAQPLTAGVKANAERLAAEAGLEIDSIRKKNFRKEERLRAVLSERGDPPGWVGVFSALEPCDSLRPWRDQARGRCSLRRKDGQCLHSYFYFIDPQRGRCSLRVPTGCPFRLQVLLQGSQRAGVAEAQERDRV